ncbi:MAG: CYTH domain-containing protein [Bacteroidales bacterium]
MGIEIERKFLVKNDDYKKSAKGVLYLQGFLNSHQERVVRVRQIGKIGFITIKGISVGAIRAEFEYEIPGKDAEYILANLCEKPLIRKYRYAIDHDGLRWEVDEFLDENKGLVIAEVELKNENQMIRLPHWVGEEITSDPAYYNSNLISNPFCNWKK